ncbi:MAG: type IV pilus modification protein PilV [Betaproteobacteria bacterium]|nr:type IV pilus modification protein PilV [Betaproteobacteria bacterium]
MVSVSARRQRGTSLIEVLVTIVILAIGLLGLAGLQSRLQASEMESYQRAQALVLLNDMASRIEANRAQAANYAAAAPVSTPLGAGMTCPAAGTSQLSQDVAEWCEALQGAAETSGGSAVGAMIGGRGCVETTATPGEYLVTVAWQGLTPIANPTGSPTCGAGKYNGAIGSSCTGDSCRRFVTTIVRIANLSSL